MHRSRLCSFGIDCQTGDVQAAAKFWSQALGRKANPGSTEKYVDLGTNDDDPILFVQQVDHPSRVHLDIESDDVEAEANRLEKLGAKKIEKRQTWWIMEAPTGHRFCVVRQQRSYMPDDANVWE